MYLPEVESGAPGGGRSGCWAIIVDYWASVGGSYRHQRAAAQVCFSFCGYHNLDVLIFRLNVHLSSIVASKPFQMPVEVLPRAMYGTDNES